MTQMKPKHQQMQHKLPQMQHKLPPILLPMKLCSWKIETAIQCTKSGHIATITLELMMKPLFGGVNHKISSKRSLMPNKLPLLQLLTTMMSSMLH